MDKLNAAMAARAASPQGMAEAAGYKTTADLTAEAQKAVDIYSYMSTSGKYSADVVTQAWNAANEALIASGDKQAIAAQTANAAITELDAKILGIQQSYANEAPEEVMGTIEAAARAQVAALEQQRDAAKANIDAVKADLQPLVDGGVKIPIDFWVRTGAPGVPATSAPTTGDSGGGGAVDTSGIGTNAGKVLTMPDGSSVVLGGNSGEGRYSTPSLPASYSPSSTPPGGMSARASTTVIIEQDGRATAEYLLPFIADETTRLRLNG